MLGRYHLLLSAATVSLVLASLFTLYPNAVLVALVGTAIGSLIPDAVQARFYLDWRNRAGYTAVTAPLLSFFIQMLIGFTGSGVTSCVNLVQFF